MGAFETFPYTNFQDLNLNWIIKKMKELLNRVNDVEKYVNDKIDDQDKFLQDSIKALKEEIEENLQWIQDNIQPLVENYINEQIEAGLITIGMEYDAETEALNVVISPINEGV